ncbi:MAG TPA: branched-chain amino acid ABC transporter permease [Syntrophales bacterium]|nr:branched-chain amino acid ABC transporter permease [Syntrophales bacterium]HPQ45673.1 branched-chain amino acid ABC transporter permease [Syntrophales bacterium]
MEGLNNQRTQIVACLLVLVGMIVLSFILPVYAIMVITEILIMGFFAMSFNIIFGYTGLLSFGQAGFFGVGAYVTALIIMHGGQSLILAIVASGVAAAVVAAVIGYLCVKRNEIYFAMITLAFGMMLYTIAHNWIQVTGGSDGLPLMNIPPLHFFGAEISLFEPRNMFLFVLTITSLGVYFMWRIVRSPFGLMLTAIRENMERLSFVGANVRRLRLWAFIISGAMAGIAGGLLCIFNSMATPDSMHWSASSRPILMTVLGGSGIFFGPMIGAVIFFGLEQVITNVTENWMIILGIILIPVVIFFPRGILGTLVHWINKKRELRT